MTETMNVEWTFEVSHDRAQAVADLSRILLDLKSLDTEVTADQLLSMATEIEGLRFVAALYELWHAGLLAIQPEGSDLQYVKMVSEEEFEEFCALRDQPE